MSEGQKFDDGKQDWYLLPLELLQPLAEVMLIGEKKGYGNFSCLDPFSNPNRRFFNSGFRHQVAAQKDPLAINVEYDQHGNKVGECYHLACSAFSDLMRLYHAKKEASLQEELDREHQANCELDMAAREFKKAMIESIIHQLEEQGDD